MVLGMIARHPTSYPQVHFAFIITTLVVVGRASSATGAGQRLCWRRWPIWLLVGIWRACSLSYLQGWRGGWRLLCVLLSSEYPIRIYNNNVGGR